MNRQHLAAGFFLIAHDEFTGKLRISRELLGCGLVAAELADLVISGRLGIVDGRVVVAATRGPGDDDIEAFVVDSVARQPAAHTIRAWTETLDTVLYGLLARRLAVEGVVRRESGRGLLRKQPDRFPAVDLLAARRPRVQLEQMLSRPRSFDLGGAFTASLVTTVGVEAVLDPSLDRAVVRTLTTQLIAGLPAELKSLLDGVALTVAAVSLTIRR